MVSTKLIILKKATFTIALISLLLITSGSIFSQNFFDYQIELNIEGGNNKHAKIYIKKNGIPYRIIESKSKYDIKLAFGEKYEITATKIGYISKSIIFNTKVPVEKEQVGFGKFISVINLKPQPNEDEEIIYIEPIAKIEYNIDLGVFDINRFYEAIAKQMQLNAETYPRKRSRSSLQAVERTDIAKVYLADYKPQSSTPENGELAFTSKISKTIEERMLQQERLKITYRTVNINGEEMIYRKEEFNWGGVYFYKNDKNITENTFENDTQ